MFQDDILYSLATFAAGAYLFYIWCGDCSYFRANGADRKGAFAGARPASLKAVAIAVVCALALLGLQMFGENELGFASEQTKVGIFALFSWMAAAFLEELVFRGYLVVQSKGMPLLVGSAFLFSVLFALAHPFLWDYTVADGASVFAGEWKWNISARAFYNTACIFTCSLLFYFLRFAPNNKARSLLPCVAAHFAFNLGVFCIKAWQGFVEWTF